MRLNFKLIRNRQLDGIKKLKKALGRKNGLVLEAMVELISRGCSERLACEQLNINYKIFRYLLGKDSTLSTHVKDTLNRARDYRATRVHELRVRKARQRAARMRDSKPSK